MSLPVIRAGLRPRRRGVRPIAAAFSAVVALALVPATAGAASVDLDWDPNPEPVDGYKLYYDVDSGDPYEGTQANEGASPIDIPVGSLSDQNAPAIVLTGLPSCETFYFAVSAYNSSGESAKSAEVVGIVVDAPNPLTVSPFAPFSLEAKWAGLPPDDDGSIRFYQVHYDTDSGEPYQGPNSPFALSPGSLADPDHPSYVLSGLVAGTTYYLSIKAVCPGDFGKYTDEATGVPTGDGSGGGNVGGAAAGGTGGFGNSGGTDAGGQALVPDPQQDEAGCTCRATRPASGRGGPAAALLVLALGVLRRRRVG